MKRLALLGVVCSISAAVELDAIEGCSADNWGMPHQSAPPYRATYEKEILNQCRAQFEEMIPMSDLLDHAMVNHYKTTAQFKEFKGVEWVPENHKYFKPFSPWGVNFDTKSVAKKTMKAATCDHLLEDGSTWTITRIGPFVTTGGYDWVQVGWDNLWDLRDKFKQYPEGVYVLDQISVPVLADGTRLGNPPIHIHHIHVGPSPGVRQQTDAISCMTDGEDCYDPTRVFEHHGDYQCLRGEGELECLTESAPHGYGKLLTFELGLEGDINDVRAPNSPALEWYYELGARWIPKNDPNKKPSYTYPDNIKAMSFHNFAGPGDFKRTDQSTWIFTYQAPTDQESIFWYTGRMHHTGKLLRNKQHAHNLIYREALFIAATPTELGLTDDFGLKPEKPYKVIKTKDTAFSSNDEVKAFVLDRLKQGTRLYAAQQSRHMQDKSEVVNVTSTRLLRSGGLTTQMSTPIIHDKFRHGPPRVICHSVNRIEEVDGYFYDRIEPTCCTEWDFTEGEVFTVLAFHDPVSKEVGPYMKHPPPTWPGHIGWWLSYDTQETPEKSHFSILQYTNDPDFQIEFGGFTATHKFQMMLNGGTISSSDESWMYMVASTIVFTIKHLLIILALAVVGIFYVGWRKTLSREVKKLLGKL